MVREIRVSTASGQRCGADNHNAKLTQLQIDEIRRLHDIGLGIGYRTLARQFNVAKSTIRDIVKCRRWFAQDVTVKRVRV